MLVETAGKCSKQEQALLSIKMPERLVLASGILPSAQPGSGSGSCSLGCWCFLEPRPWHKTSELLIWQLPPCPQFPRAAEETESTPGIHPHGHLDLKGRRPLQAAWVHATASM